ncbi:MAG TPA: VWA domain-containing protein [Gammaproteobacteria bacterium]|nr:VWA domain-containing protein [Gammaproteobacteria bacterium]
MAEFHFLRPWWLVLLPAGVWLIWQLLRGRGEGGGWRGIVDAALRPHVLVDSAALRERRWPLLAAIAAWSLGVLGMAGPAWERLPVPAFRSQEALVVALDLSRSMDAADVEPTRLARAKLKLLDLLGRRAAGQTALVVFSSHAFTVTPLTTDTRTISALVSAVATQIMPSQGSSLAAGLEKAGALLEQTGLSQGDVLLITDSDVSDDDVDLARELRGKGFRVSALAVGTEQGAPIARDEGGFVTDDKGNVVIPQLDPRGLQRLAGAGGGRFARLSPDDRDLDTLFPTELPSGGAIAEEGGEQHQADIWRDRGLLLAVALLPLLALSFRRGWICALALCAVLPLPRAEAFEWSDLWQRPDQRGFEAMQANDAARAAALFKDPAWKGAAEFRAEDFPASAATLDRLDTPDGNYNRGNALAKSGKLEEAIGAYERTLELDPNHDDARYNRDLLRDFLEKQQQQQQQQQGQNGDQQNQQSDQQQGDSQADKSDDSSSDPSKQGDQSQQDQQANGDRSQQGDDSQSPDDENPDQQQQTANQPPDQQPQEAQSPQDVEHWASEQAAEQWLRRIPQDPGGLLRRKFLYQYQRMGVDQDGKPIGGTEKKPW